MQIVATDDDQHVSCGEGFFFLGGGGLPTSAFAENVPFGQSILNIEETGDDQYVGGKLIIKTLRNRTIQMYIAPRIRIQNCTFRNVFNPEMLIRRATILKFCKENTPVYMQNKFSSKHDYEIKVTEA